MATCTSQDDDDENRVEANHLVKQLISPVSDKTHALLTKPASGNNGVASGFVSLVPDVHKTVPRSVSHEYAGDPLDGVVR